MKILLQHTKTKKFLKGAGVWTEDSEEALFFHTTAAAATYFQSCPGPDVQLVEISGSLLQPLSDHS